MSLKVSVSGDFTCFAFSLDGKHVYVRAKDNVLRLWDIERRVGKDAPTAIEANGAITSISSSVFHPSSPTLPCPHSSQADCWIAASADSQVRRYKKASLELESSVTATNGLQARCGHGQIIVWDISGERTPEKVAEIAIIPTVTDIT